MVNRKWLISAGAALIISTIFFSRSYAEDLVALGNSVMPGTNLDQATSSKTKPNKWAISSSPNGNEEPKESQGPAPKILLVQVGTQSQPSPAQTQEYVDLLIDPNALEPESNVLQSLKSQSIFSFYQELEAVFYYEDNSDGEGSLTENAVMYSAFIPSANYGDWRINLVVLDEASENSVTTSRAQRRNRRQRGLRRFSIEQKGLPLTESVSMDNVFGTHRTARLEPSRYRTGLINQRFGSVEPDILGVTSRLRYKNSSAAISVGDIGESRGSLLPGFIERSGNVKRAQFYGATKWNAYSADFWKTDNFEDSRKNINGWRLNWSSIWKRNIVTSVGFAKSGDSNAALFGARQKKGDFAQELGLYYFDPNFIWIDKRIGNDNAGIYYRYSNRRGALGYGLNIEHRQDGIKANSAIKRDTLFFSGNANYRLNRNSRLNAVYSFRDMKNETRLANSSEQHFLRVNYSSRQSMNTTSNIGANYQTREFNNSAIDSNLKQVYYTVERNFLNDTHASIGIDYSQETNGDGDRDNYRLHTNWQSSYRNGSSLNLGAGYNLSKSGNADENYWSAQANYNWPISSRLTLLADVNYNQSYYDLDEERLELDGLFTSDFFDLDSIGIREREQFSATLKLDYSFGDSASSSILGGNGRLAGSGKIQGRIFIDENADGIYQVNEIGLSGVTVYLDSVYPTTTDSRGGFSYNRAGTGQHQLFIDEGSLALPYTLSGNEYTDIEVRLRKTNFVDIPVKIIQ